MYNIVPRVFGKSGSIFDNFFDDLLEKSTRGWTPPVEFHEDETKYELFLELPGIRKDQVDIILENNILTISGEKKSSEGKRTERKYGTFSRSFSISDSLDQDKIAAKFDNGILIISIHKKPSNQPKKIVIDSI